MEWIVFGIVVGCLIISAFFSASETALTGSSRASMRRLEKQGSGDAGVVNALLSVRERMIGAILIGNNLANIAASALATFVFTVWFGDVGVLYATATMTVIVVIFSEVLPKTVAINAPDRVALLVARPMRLLVWVLAPVLWLVDVIVRSLLRMAGRPIGANQPILSPTERLRGAVDLIHHEGGVEKGDRDMLDGLLDLNDLHVSDVMVHRTEMTKINAGLPPDELVREVLKTEFTRVPLWRDKPENIVGVLHAKDVLRAIRESEGDLSRIDVNTIMRPPWFVPDMRPLSDQLKAFRRRKTHFAMVVDEYGEVQGLVTLEDILEEIVGEIDDEHDVVFAGVRSQPDGSVLVEGSVPIRDLNRALDWQLPDDEATTIAGLVIHESRSIPEKGQNFTFHGFRFRVLRRERNRIVALKIAPVPNTEDNAQMPLPRGRRMLSILPF